ncbi:helix-turn-helix domain-containing protein [Streptomyces sp. H34-S4]|uniref:helix-turn-helix domain-containing protein n=1 Tax=Streptomyces sp. H34-S4 TaxID=2996463 RepID=UPI00226D7473|nr:helix-turn-helix domain-containing protein [Streptomyces sp. H34-S4]MCY0937457.1 helix-turn-helix domain-containing protein [Streptomyces sp. H34-S4]
MIGNHLLQHRELSATAIGIGAHIQSLPDGAPVGIKALAERFPEGEVRIGSALRELERHGYLARRRERLESGQVATRTYSYNKPGAVAPDTPPPPEDPPTPPPPDHEPVPDPEQRRDTAPTPAPESAPEPGTEPGPDPKLCTEPGPVSGAGQGALPESREPDGPEAGPGPAPVSAPVSAPETGAAPEPAPQQPHPGAAGLLAGLRRYDPRLLLAERDVARLVPGVSAWLERGADAEAVGQVLSQNLPEPLRNAASVLAYRLTALIPPDLPPAPPVISPAGRRRPDPLQNCDGCDRAFRAPQPGRCRHCPPPGERAAA